MTLSVEQRAVVNEAKRIQREVRKAATKARPKSPKADRGRERDRGYLAFLRRQPCRIGLLHPGTCEGPVEACHVRYGDTARGKLNPGLQCKPSDCWATSCCASHHREQHAAGNERAWWASYGLDGLAVAAGQYAQYQGQTKDQTHD